MLQLHQSHLSRVVAALPQAASRCRRIDRVTVKGSQYPEDLYTFDVHAIPSGVGCYCAVPGHFLDANFADDDAIKFMQAGIPTEFQASFKAGVDAYLLGALN